MSPTDRLILEQQPYLKALARNVAKTLPLHVDYDELVAFGQIGLAEAAKSFDLQRGVSFTTFAHYRIRGAIFDGLRKMTWLPPAARRGVTANAAADEIAQIKGEKTADTPEALAARFTTAVERLGAVFLLSSLREGEQSVEPVDGRIAAPGPEVGELRARLKKAIESLPDDQAALLRMLYVENMSMAQVGEKLGKNKSTVCRRHAELIDALRGAMIENAPAPSKRSGATKQSRSGAKRSEPA